MALTAHGPSARICWSYRPAATLGPWELTADSTSTRMSAKVITADAHALTQPGLTFRWSRSTGRQVRFPILSLQIADGTVTAQLGPEE